MLERRRNLPVGLIQLVWTLHNICRGRSSTS